jgi:long-chain acyl-CoA synthetase
MNGLEPGGSLARLLAWRSAERPGHPFLWVEEEGPWTIGGLAAAAQEIAGRLESAGVQAGDRVLVRVGNDSRFLPALTAVWLRGGAAVVMHPGAPADDVVAVIDAMGPAAVVAPEEDRGCGAPAVPCIALSSPDAIPETRSEGMSVPECSDGETALVLLTSGSTGKPKGVALSHAAAWANLAATVSAFRRDTRPAPIPAEPKPPNLIANPLSHTAGIVRLLFALYVGRSVVLLRKFDARAAQAAVLRHGIDHLTLNPAMLRMLLHDLPPDAGLGRVRYVSSGTAPLPPALREAFEARFGVPVIGAYGQTEAFGGIAVEKVGDVLAGRRRPGSVGRPLPGVEVRIVTAEGRQAAAGEQGEIWARSAAVTSGYVGEAGDRPPVDSDGWLHTGDLGHLDADGYLYITGRLRNVIICGGFNVVPEEVEARLLDDPAVRDAAVVALPDERLGEIPVALVETDDDGDAVLERVGPRLAAYKRPRLLFAVATLPRVTNGKIDQAATRRLAAGLAGAARRPGRQEGARRPGRQGSAAS